MPFGQHKQTCEENGQKRSFLGSADKTMVLDPALKNINSLCGSQVLLHTIPQMGAMILERILPVSVCSDFWNC